ELREAPRSHEMPPTKPACFGQQVELTSALNGSRSRHTSSRPARRQRCPARQDSRSEEHTSELQSRENLVCRLLLEKKNSYSELLTLLKFQKKNFNILKYQYFNAKSSGRSSKWTT